MRNSYICRVLGTGANLFSKTFVHGLIIYNMNVVESDVASAVPGNDVPVIVIV